MSGKTACVLLLSFFLSLSAKEASAQFHGEYWQDTATGLCLDSNNSGDAYTHVCGGDYQRWARFSLGVGIMFRDLQTDRCLDSDGFGRVFTTPCHVLKSQNWYMTDTGGQQYEIKNVITGLCLDSNFEGNLYALACNGGKYQRWHLR